MGMLPTPPLTHNNTMARAAPTFRVRPATRQSKAEPPAPLPPRSTRTRGALVHVT
jgi:hypothetical protein